MKKYGLNELREAFLAFFEEKGHLRVPGFSLIPHNDESLLLINSGMAPMKPWFTGEQEPPRKRVCTCQKCIRTVDIDNVGKSARHGSYFEMLGNFSFGDYFKRESLFWSWEFLTERLGLDPDLLYPSVYLEDDEAYNIWKNEIGVAPERIFKFGKEDNFWDHGSGPCGPCSEIYFDRGADNGCNSPDCAPGCDCDRYVEVWNNVFTQFDNDGSGNYTELSQKNIDTGMGLERLACVCQGVGSMFEIDTIVRIIDKVSEISGISYGDSADSDVSIRIITDHTRAATMMICDGVLPSNEGRGYVLRRLIRRAARRGQLLGISGTFLCDICNVVIDLNKNAYPDLIEKTEFIIRTLRAEEDNFGKTIDAGTSLLSSIVASLKEKGKTVLSGADAFKLYDTYGFPLDLTIDMLEEHNMTVDIKAFDIAMEKQRTRARAAREALGDLAWAGIDLQLDNTPTKFIGYENTKGTGKILAIVTQEKLVTTINEGDEGIIVLDKTPFYAESGGQAADIGIISLGTSSFSVTGVQTDKGDKFLHHGKVTNGTLAVGDAVDAEIDAELRLATMRAHSATHLLHEALHEVLGEHVNQAGSLVEADKIRFDFTHFNALTKDELSEIERRVNVAVLEGSSVTTSNMKLDEAKKLGAAALFGEKYGENVRVIKMGDSIELCGGTHLENTAKVGAFVITAEFSVASGVRRIEATTGAETLTAFSAARAQLSQLSSVLKANSPDELVGKVEQNIASLREMRTKLEAQNSKNSGDQAVQMLTGARDVGDLKVLALAIRESEVNVDGLRLIQDALRERRPTIVSVLALNRDGKITITATCGKEAVAKGIKAGELIREITKICGGSGGGKPEFAMGGGKDESKLEEALSAVEGFVREKMG